MNIDLRKKNTNFGKLWHKMKKIGNKTYVTEHIVQARQGRQL